MSTTQAIVVQPKGTGFTIVITPEAAATKEAALAKGKPIVAVTNADEQTAAIQAAAAIKGLLTETEATRKAVKQPYWDAGKAVDDKAKEYAKELETEAKRLEGLVAAFQRAEQAKIEAAKREAARAQQEAEQAAQRERDRLAAIERQKIEAERRERERIADMERQKAEAERRAMEAKTKKAREAAAAEAARLEREHKNAQAQAAAEAARLEEERQQAEIDKMEAEEDAASANATVVYVATPAATGATIRNKREFEVTDIDAFYAFDLQRRKAIAEKVNRPLSDVPSWLKIEVRKQDVNDFISVLEDEQLQSVPGLKITQTVTASARGVASALALPQQ